MPPGRDAGAESRLVPCRLSRRGSGFSRKVQGGPSAGPSPPAAPRSPGKGSYCNTSPTWGANGDTGQDVPQQQRLLP